MGVRARPDGPRNRHDVIGPGPGEAILGRPMNVPKNLDPAHEEFRLFSSPFYLIAHADFRYHEDLDKAIAKFGLDRTTYRLLTVLMQKSPLNIKDLATYALVKRSTASRALMRMKREGWVDTAPNSVDNRLVDVTITALGRERTARLMELASRQLHRAVEGLDDGEIRHLVATLQHIVENLSRLPIE